MDVNTHSKELVSDRLEQKKSSRDQRYGVEMSSWPRDLEIAGWSESICSRTRETKEHVLYVASMTVKLARLAGIPECDVLYVRNGALLHDIGKVGIPEEILLKPQELSPSEWNLIRNHPRYAYDLLFPLSYLRPYLTIPFHHHEKWDGSGYPQGLKGEQIPLAARLFAVVDVWDSLSSDQVFRRAWPHEKVMEFIQRQAGAHFDPMAVKLFLTVISDRKMKGCEGKRELSLKKRRNITL